MKVFFLMPLSYSVYQIQIAALSAYLKRNGHEIKYAEFLLDGYFDKNHQDTLSYILKTFSPDLIGFSSYEMSYEWVREMSTFIKTQVNTPIIVGGYFATLSPDLVIAHPAIDLVCVGEGERPLSELLERMENDKDISDIKSLYVKKNGTIHKNKVGDLTENLDELPFIDRTIIDYQEHIGYPSETHDSFLCIMASKGCPFNCSYCSNMFFKNLYDNSSKYVRFRSPGNIIEEIEECERNYKFNKISFEDDMFTVSPKWLKSFVNEYNKRFSYPSRCNIRPESANKETLRLLKEMGCEIVSVGLEAGDEKIRRDVLRRKMSDEKIITAANNIKEAGIKLRTYNMVGIPSETVWSLAKTIMLNFKIAPYEVQTTIYYPLKGTDLGDKCYEEGLVDTARKKGLKTYANDTALNLNGLPRSVIIIAKWLNSATALRSGNFNLIKAGFQMVFGNLKSLLFSVG